MASASPLVSFGLPTLNPYAPPQRSLAPVATQALGDFE
jgi:hypothetical protein